jgi:hypothetical protein
MRDAKCVSVTTVHAGSVHAVNTTPITTATSSTNTTTNKHNSSSSSSSSSSCNSVFTAGADGTVKQWRYTPAQATLTIQSSFAVPQTVSDSPTAASSSTGSSSGAGGGLLSHAQAQATLFAKPVKRGVKGGDGAARAHTAAKDDQVYLVLLNAVYSLMMLVQCSVHCTVYLQSMLCCGVLQYCNAVHCATQR